MDNVLDRRNKLIKKSITINLLLMPCWILSIFISVNSMTNFLPILEVITLIMKMDYMDRYMFLNLVEFLFKYFPTIIYIGGKVYVFNINKEINRLNQEYDFELLQKIEKNKKNSMECVIIDEDEVKMLYDIVERFEKLPRNRQMEILNYIKGDLELYDKELAYQIDMVSDKYRESLLTECEDILFPSVEDSGYSKKREK